MSREEPGQDLQQPTRQDQRRAAWDEFRAIGEQARASRYKPDVYAVVARFALNSQAMAERLLATRRLDARLSLLVPRSFEARPTPAQTPEGGEAETAQFTVETAAHVLSGDRLMLVASKLAAAIDCLNHGALIGKDDLRALARDYGEAAMRFGLKFRSAVPVWMLELVRGNQGSPMQLAATAILVWSAVEEQPLTKDIQHGLASLQPVPVRTLDDPQETVEFVRLALTASNTQ